MPPVRVPVGTCARTLYTEYYNPVRHPKTTYQKGALFLPPPLSPPASPPSPRSLPLPPPPLHDS